MEGAAPGGIMARPVPSSHGLPSHPIQALPTLGSTNMGSWPAPCPVHIPPPSHPIQALPTLGSTSMGSMLVL
eukprot:366024-Chlamydomonas_euryale.AAC.6